MDRLAQSRPYVNGDATGGDESEGAFQRTGVAYTFRARTRRRTRARTPLTGKPVTTRHHALRELTEIALADRFVDRHHDELRFVAGWNRWMWYDGFRWLTERTHLAFEYAKLICRQAAMEAGEPAAAGIATSRTTAAIVTLARADRRLAATSDQWDRDAWLLNAPDETIDLRTGLAQAPQPDDYITRMTAVRPDPEWPIITWLAFLGRTFGEDAELIGYVRRVLGYALTGSTSEQAMFFGYGTGANGKSVLIDTVAGILGDYHRTAPIETFTVSATERHPTELAALRGARLVTAIETEEGRRWAESRIKALTGGDTIAARFMRQDFFEFKPEFKLVIAGNHKPGLRSVDEAMRRRFNLIPFGTTIPPEERDPGLTEKLRLEWPGILAWMIDGCLQWQERGLDPPKAVTDATTAYLEAEDAMGAWLQECCAINARHSEASAALYGSWKAWAERAGEKPGSQKRFAQTLEARGFTPRRTKTERRFEGLMVMGSGDEVTRGDAFPG